MHLNRIIIKYNICLKIHLTKIYNLMMLFQPELGWSVLELLGRSADSIRWTPLQKQETKRIGGSSPVASPMPKLVFSGEVKINCLWNEFSVHKSAYLSLMEWTDIYNG